jgi:lysophospholipase L1-like esterase
MINKSFLIAIILLAVFGAGLYFYLAYANIYNKIHSGGLVMPDAQYYYMFNPELSNKIKYAAIGDSLTAGVGVIDYKDSYPYEIAQKLADSNKNVELADFSLLGARAEDVVRELLNPAINNQPSLVTLLVGVNDVRERTDDISFKKNYEYIVSELSSKTSAKINLISIPLIGSDKLYLPPYRDYFKERTRALNKIIKNIAAEHKLNYIDITTPTEKIFEHDGAYYSVDSFHPSAEGYKVLTQIIYDHLDY